MSRFDPRDRRFLIGVAAALMIVTIIPYLAANWTIPAGFTPSGVHYQNSADWQVYSNYAQQARAGAFLVRNAFTTDDDRAVYLFPVFVVTGWLSALTGAPVWWAIQLLRVLLIPVLVYLLALLFRRLAPGTAWRWALVIFLFAGGYGQPAEWPDLVPFLGLLFSPHYVLTWILFAWILLRIERVDSWLTRLELALAETLLILTHPFAGVVMAAVIGLTLILRRRWTALVSVAVFLLPIAVYELFLMNHQGSQQYLGHNALLLSAPWKTILGSGTVFLLALFSWRHVRQWPLSLRLLLAVEAGVFILPLPAQLRLLAGLALPVALLAGATAQYFFSRLRNISGPRSAAAVVALLLFVTSGWAAVAMVSKTILTAPQYAMDPDLTAALRWFEQQASPDARVLSTQFLGNLIAGRAGLTVFLGHGVQTPGSDAKNRLVDHWQAGALPAAVARQTLADHRITHVLFYRPAVSATAGLPLERVFTSGDYVVYRVTE